MFSWSRRSRISLQLITATWESKTTLQTSLYSQVKLNKRSKRNSSTTFSKDSSIEPTLFQKKLTNLSLQIWKMMKPKRNILLTLSTTSLLLINTSETPNNLMKCKEILTISILLEVHILLKRELSEPSRCKKSKFTSFL